MGERLIENCHLYFTDLSGEPFDLGEIGEIAGKIEETTNNISLDCDEENPPTFNMTIKLDEPIDWSALTTVTEDNVITMDTKFELTPELRKEIEQVFQEKINEVIIPDKYNSKGLVTIEKLNEIAEKNSKIYERHKSDKYNALIYGLEQATTLAEECTEAFSKFAESSKIVYNKEKEKKGEEMKKSTFALPIIGVRFQGSVKTYAYFVTKEVLETYFKYINDYCALTNQHLPYVTITNEVDYNYKNSKVMFIGLAKTPMMLNCPTHIITKINYAFSCAINPYELGQGSDDFRPFGKYKLAGKDWFEKISIYPVPKTLCNEYFNSNKDFLTLKTYNNIDETKIENKGDNKMNFNKIFPNAEIGKAKNVKMSVYGPAFHTYEEREVAFKDGEWIDVTGLTFDFCPAYVCPVKASEIAVGDFIKHLNCWCRVIGIDGVNITAENIAAHEVITILPIKSMFGFDFYSKLILPFGDFTANMGDMFSNPVMTMMLFGGDSKDFNDMLPLMLMSGGKFDMSNPMMLYFLMKENKADSARQTTRQELCF